MSLGLAPNKRQFCMACLAGLCGLGSLRALAREERSLGCVLRSSIGDSQETAVDHFALSRESGDPLIDKGMPNVLGELLPLFAVEIEFGQNVYFYNDTAPGNAEVRTADDNVTPRLVLVGRELVGWAKRVDGERYGGALTGVLAHEIAHVFQLRSTYFDELVAADDTRRLLELHADFLAGWALPQLPWMRRSVQNSGAAAKQLFAMGDIFFNERDHHGTHQQRHAAISSGFFWALDNPRNIVAAAQYGRDFLKGLFPEWWRRR